MYIHLYIYAYQVVMDAIVIVKADPVAEQLAILREGRPVSTPQGKPAARGLPAGVASAGVQELLEAAATTPQELLFLCLLLLRAWSLLLL